MRTTSSLESMNAVLKRMFPNHPHLFKFIDRLRLHEFSKTLDMIDAVRSDDLMNKILRRRRKNIQRRDEKIKQITELFKTHKEMTAGSFLKAMATENVLPGNGKQF